MEIDVFLERLREQGRWESPGAFNVGLRRSAELLQSSQLADSSFFLLRLVQAAVCGGADQVHLRIQRDAVSAEFRTPQLTGLADNLWAIAAPERQSRRFLHHLGSGVAAAVGAKQDLVIVDLPPRARLQIEPGKSPTIDMMTGMDENYRITLERRSSIVMAFEHAAEHASVSTRAANAPLDFLLDARRVHPPRPSRRRELSVLVETGGFKLLLDAANTFQQVGEGQFRDPGGRFRVFQTESGEPLGWPTREPANASLYLGYHGQTENPKAHITFIQDGVNLDVVERDLGVGRVHGLVDATDLPVDHSGMRLLESEALEAKLGQIASLAKRIQGHS